MHDVLARAPPLSRNAFQDRQTNRESDRKWEYEQERDRVWVCLCVRKRQHEREKHQVKRKE